MSKEIDFSNAPEGATHYYLENEDDHFAWAKYVDGKIYISVPAWDDCWTLYTDFHGDHPIKIPAAWSIYTNDKPLCELSNEQAAALFNAWRGGGEVEALQNTKSNEWIYFAMPTFSRGEVYRIKTKSERELFVEAAMQLMTSETERTLEQQFCALFDSGKFKLVEQPK